MDYTQFIQSKTVRATETGFYVSKEELNPCLYNFQKEIVCWTLAKGKSAIFADCGLGKTLMQLEWARQILLHTRKSVLILCPLAVAAQTIDQGIIFNIDVKRLADYDSPGIYITNYEQLKNVDCSLFDGIVLDESSILKNFSGSIKAQIISSFKDITYKLACTATPSPNDEIEIGNHAEFLNVCSSQDMVSTYFTTDKNRDNGNKYRLKRHAEKDFYRWISTWAIMLNNPESIDQTVNFKLPELILIEHNLASEKKEDGLLFNVSAVNAMEFNAELRRTMKLRLDKAAEIVSSSNESFIIWIKHNEEGRYLRTLLPEAVEVAGNDSLEYKEKMLSGFAKNEFRILITKAKIAQFGLNYQNCHNQIFASLDFSFESLYQSIRRSYRYGQKHNVNIHLITTDTMNNVIGSIREKQAKFIKMQESMIPFLTENNLEISRKDSYTVESEYYKALLGDCVVESCTLPAESMDYIFFSPPFGALYVFSSDPADMSNCRNNDEFFKHFEYLIPELLRVLKPGRLLSIHMMQSTTLLGRDGYYSIVDFRGDLIRIFQKHGFIYHAENMIRKDPKIVAIRTKNHQLMWGTTKRDSSIVRPGLADFILTFRKPGENKVPIVNDIPFDRWCQIAEPVWTDINETETLEVADARDNRDERHLTATQLKSIENCLLMWSNKEDVVFSPFMGIGSEGYQAIKMGRRFVGIELKESYFRVAVQNLQRAEDDYLSPDLFAVNQ